MTWWLLQHLATVSILIVAVHALSRVVKLSASARHALWAIVLVKLVTPPLVIWPWAISDFAATGPRFETASTVSGVPAESQISHAAVIEPTDAVKVRSVQPDWTVTAPRPPIRWWAITIASWLVGSLVFIVIQGLRAWRLVRISRGSSAPSPAIARAVDDLSVELGVHPPRVRLAEIDSPVVWSLFRPTLLWPAHALSDLSDDGIRGLVTHELAHVKRRDHWVAWLELIAGVAWWWNPLFWHARARLRANAELACDSWAASLMAGGRRRYAEALLQACALPASPVAMPAVGVRTNDRRFLERRLAVIMQTHVPVRLSRATVCVMCLCALVVMPAWAQMSEPTPVPVPVQTVPAPTARPIVLSPAPVQDSAEIPGLLVPPVPPVAPVPPVPPVLAVGPSSRALVEQYDQARARYEALTAEMAEAERSDRSIRDASRAVVAAYTALTRPDQTAVTVSGIPTDAAELLARYNRELVQLTTELEEKLERQRQELIPRLQEIQDAHTKLGNLDEALAIRTQIRTLQAAAAQRQPRIVQAASNGPIVATSSRNLRNVQGLIDSASLGAGAVIEAAVVGAYGGAVWGTGTYTHDSDLAAAAVHAGLLKVGELGRLRVNLTPGLDRYTGSTQNGVESRDFGAWRLSYQLEKMVSPVSAAPTSR